MKLSEALLCCECDEIHYSPLECPCCGSQVAYPLARKMNSEAPPPHVKELPFEVDWETIAGASNG